MHTNVSKAAATGAFVVCLAGQLGASGLPEGTSWLRVFGQVETIYLASSLPVESASTLASLSIELGANSSVQQVLVCASDEDGLPDLQSAAYVLGAVSTGAVSATKLLSPSVLSALDPGQWWVVLCINPPEQSGQCESTIGFGGMQDGRQIWLGDGSEPWVAVQAMEPRITVELSPSLLAKNATAIDGSNHAAPNSSSSTARYLGVAPNPFAEGTYFAFMLGTEGAVRVSIFDARGRLVRQLGPFDYPVGEGHVYWDARADNGAAVANGVYHARFEAPGLSKLSRLLVLR